MTRMRPLAFQPGLRARQFLEAPRKHTDHIPLRPDRHRASPAKRRNRRVAVLARATKEQQVGHCEALSTVTDEPSSSRVYERLMKAEFNPSSLAAAVATMAQFVGRIGAGVIRGFSRQLPACGSRLRLVRGTVPNPVANRHSGLLLQFLHAMLLIVEHDRGERKRAAHA